MASQIAHVVYGKKIFDRIDHSRLNWPEFMVGAVFPDIRYPAGLDRDSTHMYDTQDSSFPLEDSFMSGMYSHWLVDEKRGEILNKYDLYSKYPFEMYTVAAIKFFEDRVVYDKYSDWEKASDQILNIFDREKEYVDDTLALKNWHTVLANYFSKKPDDPDTRKIILGMGFSSVQADRVIEILSKLEKDNELISILLKIYEEI